MESDDDETTDLIAEIADYRTPFLVHQVLETVRFDPWLATDVVTNHQKGTTPPESKLIDIIVELI